MGGAEGTSDALDASITLQTQADLLQSDTLALKAIEDLGLERTEDFEPRSEAGGWMRIGVSRRARRGQERPSSNLLDDGHER